MNTANTTAEARTNLVRNSIRCEMKLSLRPAKLSSDIDEGANLW
jgi:hypothetical protein